MPARHRGMQADERMAHEVRRGRDEVCGKGVGRGGSGAAGTAGTARRPAAALLSAAERTTSTASAGLLTGGKNSPTHLLVDQACAASHVCPHLPAGASTQIAGPVDRATSHSVAIPGKAAGNPQTDAQRAAAAQLDRLSPPSQPGSQPAPARAAHPGCSRVHTTLCPARSALRLLFTMFSAALLAR